MLQDFDAVMNSGACALAREAVWLGLGVPGPFINGYARQRPGMDWINP